MPRLDGTPLRDGTPVELQAAIDHYGAQARTLAHRCRFFELVLAQVPNGKTVGSVISEQQALALYEKARP